LFAGVCRTLVEQGEFSMAWVGLADAATQRVQVACQSGFEHGYLDKLEIRYDDSPQGRGPTGMAIRSGQTVINDDTETNAALAPWREQSHEHGYRSSLAAPLRVHGQVIGSLNVYAATPHAFGSEEVVLLEKFAGDVGMAVERLRAEETLRASEARLKEAQRLAHIGSWDLDLATNHLVWSDEIFRIFEIDPSRFGASYEAFLDAIHPDDREAVNRAYTESVRNRTPYVIVHRLLMADGRIKHIQERGETLYDETGRALRSVGTVQDITERKHAEQALIQSERNYRALTENANVGILVNYQGRHVFANNKLLTMLGYSAEEFRQTGVKELVHPQEYDKVMTRFRERMAGESAPSVYETVFMTKDRQAVPVELTVAKTTWLGEPAGLLFLHDIRERLHTEEQMRKLSSALEQAADSVIITNRNGVIEYVNPGFEKTTGYSRDEALGQTPRLMKSGKQGAGFYKKLWDTILAGDVFSEVFVNRRKDGGLYYEEKTISPLKDPAGQVTHFVATGKDVTERMQTQERLQHMAQHDALTELPNRVLFLDRLKQALARARWHKRLVAVLFVDMDRFKTINDTLGHEIGDKLLQALAERFSAGVREGDTVARFGGDEFVILLDDVGSDKDIGAVAQKVLETLAPPFDIDGQSLYITASIGVSLYPNDGEDSTTLLKNADIAMYRAKELGKNTYQFYSADMSARAFERLTLESSLRHAIERNEFRLHYQPQIDSASGAILGVEALLRWQHPDFGLVAPAEFIPLLEETGLIVPAGEWVFHTACEQLRAWHAAGWPTLRMAVNLSPRQFQAAGLAMMVERWLATTGCDPGLVELEITENILLRHAAATLDTLEALRALGVRLAIDDFGTGYSSLSYLRRYSIDTLKIDRSFVHDVPGDADDSALASAIVVLAQSLKLNVIAEGVETEAQRDFLQQRGCLVMQGYLFSRPVPAEDIPCLLETRNPKG
jgi:diguanylate cyclase (GGDEF)-like protein/PAS domain S-box-containing protein